MLYLQIRIVFVSPLVASLFLFGRSVQSTWKHSIPILYMVKLEPREN